MSVSFRDGRYWVPPSAEFLARCAQVARSRLSIGDSATGTAEPIPGSETKLGAGELSAALDSLGVGAGDTLMVHSSARAIESWGWELTEMIDFLLDYLGPEGTLAMPTHPKLRQRDGREVYDVRRSPSTVGLLTEVFRRRRGVIRSQFPVSTAAAIGARAEALVGDHAKSFAPHDEHSPYAKLALFGGKALCIGPRLDRMTILHVAEDIERATLNIPDFYESREVYVKAGDEEWPVTVHVRAPWLWWYLALARWSYQMFSNGIARECRLADVALRAADARKAVDWMRDEIRRGRSIYPLARANRWLRLPPPIAE